MAELGLPIDFQAKKKILYQASVAAETKRALAKHWKSYQAFCAQHGLKDFPCQIPVLEAYFIELVDQKKRLATIEQAKWAIDAWHRFHELPPLGQSEAVRRLLKGIRRTIRSKQTQKHALTFDLVQKMPFGGDLRGLRDKLLLVLGSCGGFRRSELVGIRVEDISFTPEGLRIELQKSKTNQEGKSEHVDIVRAQNSDFCPFSLMQTWLAEAQIVAGPIFRSFYKGGRLSSRKLSDNQVGILVKAYGEKIGLHTADFSGHSLRSGLATYLFEKSVPLNLVAKQLRHKKTDTTLKYDRSQTFRNLKGLF